MRRVKRRFRSRRVPQLKAVSRHAGNKQYNTLYQARGEDSLFLPFRDALSGKETYGAGRYLDVAPPHSGHVVVDFNYAYNPSCAYDPQFSCPLPPRENWLQVPIRAGEKNFQGAETH